MSLESSIAKLTAAVEANTAAIVQSRSPASTAVPPQTPAAAPAPASPVTVAPAPVAVPTNVPPAVAAADELSLRKEAKELTLAYAEKNRDALITLLRDKYKVAKSSEIALALVPQFIADVKNAMAQLPQVA